ncbi:MAG: CopD family protein [Pusillimonas sp.]|nr:CopD family protein [Pusillimonas sp.]
MVLDALLKTLHILAVVLWVGGMIFAHFYLRPSLAELDPPTRLGLMCGVLKRFFAHVLWASIIVLVSGLWMIGRAAKTMVQAGMDFNMPLSWTIMATLGIVMIIIFFVLRFRLYPPMVEAVSTADWPMAATALARVRRWVVVNMVLGLVVVVVASMY